MTNPNVIQIVLSNIIQVNTHGEYTEYVMGDEIDPTSYVFQKEVSGRVKFIGSITHGFSVGWVFDLKQAVENGDLDKVLNSFN